MIGRALLLGRRSRMRSVFTTFASSRFVEMRRDRRDGRGVAAAVSQGGMRLE
jgi:hypothetical protein